MNIKAVIFDLDGTLLDTLDDLADAVNHTLASYSRPERTVDEVRQFVGNGVNRLIKLSFPDGTDEDTLVRATADYRSYYGAHSEVKTKPYDGVVELIDKLKENGINVAVASNKMHSATVTLCRKYFPNVESVYGENEACGVKRKPSPDMVELAMRDLGVSKDETMYVGDSEVDVLTAENSCLPCISVLWGFRDRETIESSGGKTFAHTAEELYDIILGGQVNYGEENV